MVHCSNVKAALIPVLADNKGRAPSHGRKTSGYSDSDNELADQPVV